MKRIRRTAGLLLAGLLLACALCLPAAAAAQTIAVNAADVSVPKPAPIPPWRRSPYT
jgi:hypothetical protein